MKQIQFWNRYTKSIEKELVFSEHLMKWLHQSVIGKQLMSSILSRPLFSRLYGSMENWPSSKNKISDFIREYKINMSEFESVEYKNFNDFFIRKFKSGNRSFEPAPHLLPGFVEGRYLGYEALNQNAVFPVKNTLVRISELLSHEKWAQKFLNGPCLIARLCPTDYHRFHFPDEGVKLESYQRGNRLFSVSPYAFEMKNNIFEINERQIHILQTNHFGLLAYIEVGAFCVGKIVQTQNEQKFKRGEEKGYFLFGASTVIVVGEQGQWKPSKDILEKTHEGIETFVKLGDTVGDSN